MCVIVTVRFKWPFTNCNSGTVLNDMTVLSKNEWVFWHKCFNGKKNKCDTQVQPNRRICLPTIKLPDLDNGGSMQSMWMARRQCSHSANLKPWPPHTKQQESPVACIKTNKRTVLILLICFNNVLF